MQASDIQALQKYLEDRHGLTEFVETHISWVFLCPAVAFKILKPVGLSYLDFGSLARRR